ncbi:unnamed protein product [Nesidiocoris tenuis]|uniref:Uncharacterized protein n=1 Tax=Nesidiocoris tenuis TaxID=355587 RepID=A0A6H5HKT7_9HEMI|nr:unnamed protein product [Nesidiocoris tenuis]
MPQSPPKRCFIPRVLPLRQPNTKIWSFSRNIWGNQHLSNSAQLFLKKNPKRKRQKTRKRRKSMTRKARTTVKSVMKLVISGDGAEAAPRVPDLRSSGTEILLNHCAMCLLCVTLWVPETDFVVPNPSEIVKDRLNKTVIPVGEDALYLSFLSRPDARTINVHCRRTAVYWQQLLRSCFRHSETASEAEALNASGVLRRFSEGQGQEQRGSFRASGSHRVETFYSDESGASGREGAGRTSIARRRVHQSNNRCGEAGRETSRVSFSDEVFPEWILMRV